MEQTIKFSPEETLNGLRAQQERYMNEYEISNDNWKSLSQRFGNAIAGDPKAVRLRMTRDIIGMHGKASMAIIGAVLAARAGEPVSEMAMVDCLYTHNVFSEQRSAEENLEELNSVLKDIVLPEGKDNQSDIDFLKSLPERVKPYLQVMEKRLLQWLQNIHKYLQEDIAAGKIKRKRKLRVQKQK